MNKFQLKKSDGQIKLAFLKKLTFEDIDEVLILQDEVVRGLERREFYCDMSKEEFSKSINDFGGTMIGCVTEDEEIVAIGLYVSFQYDDENYGYDLGLRGQELLKVGQVEATIVKKEFRGNKLQDKICEVIENIAIEEGKKIIGATVAPDNIYSLNTFLNRGYEIYEEKIKYGGYRRYILKKEV